MGWCGVEWNRVGWRDGVGREGRGRGGDGVNAVDTDFEAFGLVGYLVLSPWCLFGDRCVLQSGRF